MCFSMKVFVLCALFVLQLGAASLLEELFDDCPCDFQVGGYACSPDDLYVETEALDSKSSSKKCVKSKPRNLLACTPLGYCRDEKVLGNGSFVVRLCSENGDYAQNSAQIFNVHRPLCDVPNEVNSDDDKPELAEACEECSSKCALLADNSIRMTTGRHRHVRRSAAQLKPLARVFHGDIVTDEEEVPYTALIKHAFVRNHELDLEYCSGSLIAPDWVLTAFHCKIRTGDFVRFGFQGDKDGDAGESDENYTVVQVENHPKAKNITFGEEIAFINDISLLRLDRAVDEDNAEEYGVYVNTNCQFPKPCTNALVSGYGRACGRNQTDLFEHVLRSAPTRIIDSQKCKELLQGRPYAKAELSFEAHICSLHDKCRHSGSCEGDSGGPLVVYLHQRSLKNTESDTDEEDDVERVPLQVGLATWHVGSCGQDRLPDVFEPVAKYAEWIYNKTNGRAWMYPPLGKRTPQMENCSRIDLTREELLEAIFCPYVGDRDDLNCEPTKHIGWPLGWGGHP